MVGEWADKVVMITGASGNLGQAATRRFVRAGAKLVLVERDKRKLAEMVAEVGGFAGAADVTDAASVDALVKQVEAEYGRIDVLAHTVGGFAAGQRVHEAGLDVWDKMLNLNAKSVYVTAGRVAQHMVERQIQGSIVAVVAKNAYRGTAKAAAYSASKAAAQRVIESMAAELGPLGITVNAIAPSMIDTPQNRAASPNADYSKWVQPEEIADAIDFLAASRSINGHTLDIFGRA
ncbi:MAG TPA: SDR family NAD(P)-dependent oxidoreductase [Phototrophicaceae bacterium]|nr:SDR family NAD(P)-dependent oxidoreductase [Phototrophicaceae bacterium]